jgi:flagellar biosynthesis protein FlhG
MGGIPFDRKMYESVRQQKVMVEMYPGHKVSQAFEKLANNLVEDTARSQPKGSLQFFWKRLLSIGNGA